MLYVSLKYVIYHPKKIEREPWRKYLNDLPVLVIGNSRKPLLRANIVFNTVSYHALA